MFQCLLPAHKATNRHQNYSCDFFFNNNQFKYILTCIVIIEFDVPVFMGSDADGKSGVTDDSIYLAGRVGC